MPIKIYCIVFLKKKKYFKKVNKSDFGNGRK